MLVRFAAICLILILAMPLAVANEPIQRLQVDDSYSYPLALRDDGLSFSYTTTAYGDLSSFIHCGKHRFSVHDRERAIRGPGYLMLSPQRTARLARFTGDGCYECTFILSHQDRTSLAITRRSLAFLLEVSAPFGKELTPEPPKPARLSENVRKPGVSALAVVGTIVGAALAAYGSSLDPEEAGDERDSCTTVGVLLGLISLGRVRTQVPDNEANARNRRTNERQLRSWRAERQYVNAVNERIRSSFFVRTEPDD